MKLREIKLTPPIAAISVMLLTLTSTAATGVLRIAENGTGDGSSWDAPMGSISNALAKADQMVKAGECGHVELWIKKGRHYAAGVNDYALKTYLPSEVTLRGGFDGTETRADQADPAANPTFITGDRKFDSRWQRNGSSAIEDKINIWKDKTTLQMPNPDHVDMYWNTDHGPSGYDVKQGFLYSGAVSNICFNGLIFAVYETALIVPADANATADDVLFTNCTFVACVKCAELRGCRNRVVDCSFYGNSEGMKFPRKAGAATPKSAFFSNCLFEENNGAGALLSDVDDAVNGGVLAVSNCVFRYNCVRNSSGSLCNVRAGNVACTNLISDCLFVSNRVTALGRGLVTAESYVYQNGAFASLDRCQFVDNWATNTTTDTGVCLSDSSLYRTWILHDCLFCGNRDVCEAPNLVRSSVFRLAGTSIPTEFYNCTLVSNSVTALGAGSCASTLSAKDDAVTHKFLLVNCICKDNELVSGSGGQLAEIYWPKPANNCRCVAVNTIFDNETPGYLPYYFTDATVSASYTVVDVACYHPAGIDASDYSMLGTRLVRWDYAVTEKPVYAGCRMGPNGLVSFGVASRPAAVARKTIEVFINGDGKYRAYDPDYRPAAPFFPLDGFFAPGQTAAAAKVTAESPLLADAFGQPRKVGKVALGPLNAPDPGLMLLLR